MKELKEENWFWCDLCECRSYHYDCECHGTTCNAGGCEKCDCLYELAKEAERNGTAPSEESLKKKLIDQFGKITSKETLFLDKIFGEQK